MASINELLLWVFIAFWLWIVLTIAFVNFRLPAPVVVAAVLSWVAAGLLVTWVVSAAG